MNKAADELDPTPVSPIISVQGLHKRFGTYEAVRGVTFDVRQGEIFGFLGPNGAGKSTTIRMVLDLIRPSSGSVELFGQPVRSHPELRRQLGYLSGDMVLDAGLTGAQYLRFAAAQYRVDCQSEGERLAQLLKADLSKKIGDYSRGNRQKIGLIAALQHQPELLVLDEPTSGFDPLVQETFADIVRQFQSRGGTVFMSSHILSEVRQLCDRVAFIRDGALVDVTDVASLLSKSAKQVTVRTSRHKVPVLRTQLKALPRVAFSQSADDYDVHFSYAGDMDGLLRVLSNFRIEDLTIQEPDLEELFMHFYQGDDTV